MGALSMRERAALDEIEPRLRKRGYTLVREPSADQLPGFLEGFRPDAIAVGTVPSLLIEVLRSRGGPSATKVRQISSLLSGRDDWQLEVLYLSSEGAPLTAVPLAEAKAALQQARRLADSEPRAGLLLGWATLEAIARTLEPELASRSLSPGSLVDLLVSNGHLSQSDGAALGKLAETRNALAHGQIDCPITAAQVEHLIKLAEGLTRVVAH